MLLFFQPYTAVQNQSGNHTSSGKVRVVVCIMPSDFSNSLTVHVLSLRKPLSTFIYDPRDADACYIRALARQLGSEPIRLALDKPAI